MKTYATSIQDRASGLLNIDDQGVCFETFPTQTALDVLARRPAAPKISWSYGHSDIVAVTDLQGRTSAPPGVFGRILRALHVDPNGLIVEVTRDGERSRLILDCAVSVYALIDAFTRSRRIRG